MMNEWIISSSLLILAVLLGRLVLRGKISLRLQYALWGVVLLRLLMPVQFFSHDLSAGSVAREIDISTPVRQVYASANEDRYERLYDEAYQSVVAEYAAQSTPIAPEAVEKIAYTRAQERQRLDLNGLLSHIWLAGMAVMAAVIVGCNVHFIRKLRRRRWELPIADCLLPVYVTEAVPTPCIFGFFQPAIYLTPDAAQDEMVRGHVLQHELTHYRHCDHIWSVLRSVCLVLHWYNPLVWIAAKVSRADGELACDEGAMERLGEDQRGDYGRTLIGLTCAAPVRELLLTATTMTGSAGSIRERIKLLMKHPKNTVLTLTAAILLVTLAVGCTFAGAPETAEPVETVPTDGAAIPEEPTISEGAVTEVETLFTGDDRWYLRALTSFYENPAQIDLFQLFYSGIPGADNSVTAGEQAFLDTCTGYNPNYDLVRISGTEMDRILKQYFGISLAQTEGIGLEHFMYWEEGDCYYHSHTDINWGFVNLYGAEHLGDGSIRVTYTGALDTLCAVTLAQTDGGMQIVSNLAVPMHVPDLTEEVTEFFADGGDPWYLSALNTQFQNYYYLNTLAFFTGGQTVVALTPEEESVITAACGADALEKPIFRMTAGRMDGIVYSHLECADLWCLNLSGFLYCPETDAYLAVVDEVPELRRPEILAVETLTENEARMIYRFPGEEERYCATVFKGATWKIIANQLLIEKPLQARALTGEEIAQVNAAYDLTAAPGVSGFFNCNFSEPSGIDLEQFLRYYPATGEATQEEWELLRQKYGFSGEAEQIQELPYPIHSYEIEHLDQVFRRYARIGYGELKEKDTLYHLEETGCYYNFTSDANPGLFRCQTGWVYDGGAMLFDRHSVLILTEHGGRYYIQAHLPALAVE